MIVYENLYKIDNAKTLSYILKGDNRYFDNKLLSLFKTELIEEDIFRVLLHNDVQSELHNMIIALKRNKFIYPHKHVKSESYQIIEGKMALIYFSQSGNIENYVILSINAHLISRVDKNQYHAIIVLSDYVIYHETRVGPFESKNDSTTPSWLEEETKDIFMKNMVKTLNKD